MTFLLFFALMFCVVVIVALMWRDGYRTGIDDERAASPRALDTNTRERE